MSEQGEKMVRVQQMARMITENPELPVYYNVFPYIGSQPADSDHFHIGMCGGAHIHRICFNEARTKYHLYDGSMCAMLSALEDIKGKDYACGLTVSKIMKEYDSLDWENCILVSVVSSTL